MATTYANKLYGSALAVLLLGAAIPAPAQNVGQPNTITWINQVNVVADSHKLAEACNGCGNAGAESAQGLTSGDGFVEFTVSTGHDMFSVGIGNGAPSTDVANIEYALRFYGNGNVEVRERGNYVTDAKYTPGQRFRIAIEQGQVKYYTQDANGPRLIHTNTNPMLQYPIKVEAAMVGKGVQIEQVVVAETGNKQTGGGVQLSWTNLSGATAQGNTLIASGGTANAGAQSAETLSGDGWVEFTARETDKMRAIGFDHENANNTFQDIDYGIVLREARAGGGAEAEVWQNGAFVSDTPYTEGTRFRIAIENGVVKYYKYVNGSLAPIQGNNATVANYPVHVDVALYHPQATIADVTGARIERQQ